MSLSFRNGEESPYGITRTYRTGRSHTLRNSADRNVNVNRCTSIKPIEYAIVLATTPNTSFNAKKLSNEGTLGNLRIASKYTVTLTIADVEISIERVDPERYAYTYDGKIPRWKWILSCSIPHSLI